MALSYENIAEIVKIIDASSCDEVVIETSELKLVVRRRGAAGAPLAAFPTAASSPAPGAPPAPAIREEAPPRAGQVVVRAPMVGTFYRSPSPEAPPFVEIGSIIAKGDPLGLVEVMKLFTTIYAESAGRVAEIGAENGKLVEFGQMLFVIETG
jgi:acetyl-CoA carboxylase biotin carboxyl carrier protein